MKYRIKFVAKSNPENTGYFTISKNGKNYESELVGRRHKTPK